VPWLPFMTDDEFKAHRFAQARRLVELFEAANGRSEGTMEQMQEEQKIWAASPEGQAAIAINSNPDTGTIDPY
jgi:hypothetical protein